MTKTYSLLTITYRGDLEPFDRLCRSIDEHMPEVTHHVLVDHSDLKTFSRYATARRHIIDCSKELPAFKEFSFLGRRLWLGPGFRLIRGWIYQQLVKLHFAAKIEADAVMLVDSDVLFVRPLEEGDIFIDGKARLYQIADAPSGPIDQSPKWHDVASMALGLPQIGYTGHDYIMSMTVWSPQVVKLMLAHIEKTHGRRWYDVLSRPFRISEFVIYGVFCNLVLGIHQNLVARTSVKGCHPSWDHDLSSVEGREEFIETFRPEHAAVHIQSNLHLPQDIRDDIADRVRARLR